MTPRITQCFLPPREHLHDTNILRCQPPDAAAWIWHPDASSPAAPAFVRFRCDFTATAAPLVIHVSADERFVLFLDDNRIARGPARGDVHHWHYATYRIELPVGPHTLAAWCWRLDSGSPLAQHSWCGGFLLYAEPPYDAALTTGRAAWQVAGCPGQRPDASGNPDCFGIGAALTWDARISPEPAVAAVVVRDPVADKPWGVATPGWKLTPTPLPDQLDRRIRPGRIVAGGSGRLERDTPVAAPATHWPDCTAWQTLLAAAGGAVTVPPHTELHVIWDLEQYYCAYPVLRAAGGRAAELTWGWSEAPFEADGRSKGNRDEIVGKRFVCFADRFIARGDPHEFTTHWWRAGRYCVLNIATAAEALSITDLALDETRYPLEMSGRFTAPDSELPAVLDLCVRGLQMCSHETFVDCPYYEQLMYVGDTRLEVLSTFVTTADPRLPQQALRLFDASRVNWGFVNERYPSREPQHSATFSLIWALMLRDYAWWRDDPAFVAARLIGLRSMLEHFTPYRDADGLLTALPGWSFIDWVREWEMGCPPPGRTGTSSIINLFYVLALQAAAELETVAGEPLLARRHSQLARRVGRAVVAKFWDRRRGLLANEPEHMTFSEHAQSLALLAGVVTGPRAASLLHGLRTDADLHRASYYFSFYLFEALRKFGHGGSVVIDSLSRWKAMLAAGCKTPLETYEPSRSDCHAWSSQPLFHLYATVAGIRPAAPGFRTVQITPSLGPWRQVAGQMPHPAGEIEFEFDVPARRAKLTLPPGVTGTLAWLGQRIHLDPGSQTITCSDAKQ